MTLQPTNLPAVPTSLSFLSPLWLERYGRVIPDTGDVDDYLADDELAVTIELSSTDGSFSASRRYAIPEQAMADHAEALTAMAHEAINSGGAVDVTYTNGVTAQIRATTTEDSE